jgi:hypothetical protein
LTLWPIRKVEILAARKQEKKKKEKKADELNQTALYKSA